MYPFVFLNGAVVSSRRAAVPLNDIGFLRGYAVFDFAKVYSGVPFLLKEHLRRFRRSARTLGLKLSHKDSEILDMVAELLQRNELIGQDCSVRLVLSGGPITNGLQFDPANSSFAVLLEPPNGISPEAFDQGARLVTLEHQRVFPEVKTTNYLAGVMAQPKRRRDGAVEVLFTSQGRVLEASTSNVFIVKNGVTATPEANILPGITRRKVLERAGKLGLKVEDREVSLSELLRADEVFLTASNKEVLPIVAVDGRTIGDGRVGEVTGRLRKDFLDYLSRYIKRHNASQLPKKTGV